MLDRTKEFPETQKKFNVFIFNKLGKNKEKFRKFSTYPDRFKVPFYIEFLEQEGVPIVSAIVYYNYLYKGTPSYDNLIAFTIVMEFQKIEKGVKLNYTPF